jgi:hypothetical protein
MHHTGLAVIESRWWTDGNDSVRPLFETLAGIVEGNPHSVRYDMFIEKTSLSELIVDIAAKGTCHSIYIGAHGNDTMIKGLGKAEISRTVLRNMLSKSNKKATVTGIYFGSCLVGTKENAAFWLSKKAKTGLKWVAGYTKSINWIDSSAIDMIFWSKYLNERKTNRSRKKNKKTDLEMVKLAASEMKKLMPTVFDQLGFNIYHLDTGGAFSYVW